MDQMVIPTNIVKKVERLTKELEAVKKEIKNAVKVSKSQAWFWSKSWQAKEKAADKAIKEGRIHRYSSVEDLIDGLHK